MRKIKWECEPTSKEQINGWLIRARLVKTSYGVDEYFDYNLIIDQDLFIIYPDQEAYLLSECAIIEKALREYEQ